MDSSVLTFLLIVGGVHLTSANVADKEQFEFFDDYLRYAIQSQIDGHVTSQRADMTSEVVGVPEDRMQADQPREWNHIPQTPNIDVLAYFRDVPKRDWSCCLLGRLAGDKGFHCQAQFYARRVLSQNRNRPQNRLMPFNGPARDMAYGRSLMEHFSRCVSRRDETFHTCCYAATMERQALDRWRRYLNHQASLDMLSR